MPRWRSDRRLRARCSIAWRGPRRRLDAVDAAGLLAPVHARRVPRDAGAPSRTRSSIAGGTDLGVEVEPARQALAAPGQPRGDRRAARVRRGRRIRPDRRRAAARPISSGGGSGAPPVFAEWLALFASPPIRNRATLGGNLATASPIGDAAPLLLALDATRARGRAATAGARSRSRRSSPATGARRSQPGEIADRDRDSEAAARSTCASTRWPSAGSTTSARWPRRWPSIATRPDACARARFAFGGVAATPLRVDGRRARRRRPAVERRPRSSACSASLDRTLTPISDHAARREYRRQVARAWSRSSGEELADMSAAGRPVPHESARGHVTGEALYTDDLRRALSAACCTPGRCWRRTRTRALTSLDAARGARRARRRHRAHRRRRARRERHGPGPPRRAAVPHRGDVPRPARGLGARRDARGGAARRRAGARRRTSRCRRSSRSRRRSPRTASSPSRCASRAATWRRWRRAPLRFDGELAIGGQEHFYLETQAAIAWLDESGGVARALLDAASRPRRRRSSRACSGCRKHRVTVECLRMGGAFGGKEVQANAVGGGRGARRVEDAAAGARAPDARARHGADRQAPSVPGALRRRLRRRRPPAGAAARALLRRRLEPRSLRADHVARAVPLRQRLSPAGRRRASAASAARTRRRRPRSAASAARRACS